jgi:hypothetical protein
LQGSADLEGLSDRVGHRGETALIGKFLETFQAPFVKGEYDPLVLGHGFSPCFWVSGLLRHNGSLSDDIKKVNRMISEVMSFLAFF